MKKIIKWMLIIGAGFFLFHLYLPPKWTGKFPSTINEAKRAGALIGEYRINRVEVLDSTINVPILEDIFKHIWVSKWCIIKRNNLGIPCLKASQSSDMYIKFDVMDKDTLTDKWLISDKDKGIKYSGSNFDHNPQDTVYYIIYHVMAESPFYTDEDLIPLFNIELIPK